VVSPTVISAGASAVLSVGVGSVAELWPGSETCFVPDRT
jgi:hypothetical protein